jgi:hypothetical protein
MDAKHAAETEPTYPNPKTLIDKLNSQAPAFCHSVPPRVLLDAYARAVMLSL